MLPGDPPLLIAINSSILQKFRLSVGKQDNRNEIPLTGRIRGYEPESITLNLPNP